MAKYFATVIWSREIGSQEISSQEIGSRESISRKTRAGSDESFTDNQYSRGHRWEFDGGAVVEASSSPHIVPLPYSVEANVDPEEAFVASLSSCHMLFFLSIAAKKRLVVDRYEDKAVGVMGKDDKGREFVETVTLKPKVVFSGEKVPNKAVLEKMHHQAHELCFIANSVKTKVLTEVQV